MALDFRDAVTVVTGIVTLTGVFFAMRSSVSKLESGQTEMLRQLGALHKRMDMYGERISKNEINHAVLEERVVNLRESQQFRLSRAKREAASAGEPPMFDGG